MRDYQIKLELFTFIALLRSFKNHHVEADSNGIHILGNIWRSGKRQTGAVAFGYDRTGTGQQGSSFNAVISDICYRAE